MYTPKVSFTILGIDTTLIVSTIGISHWASVLESSHSAERSSIHTSYPRCNDGGPSQQSYSESLIFTLKAQYWNIVLQNIPSTHRRAPQAQNASSATSPSRRSSHPETHALWIPRVWANPARTGQESPVFRTFEENCKRGGSKLDDAMEGCVQPRGEREG